MRTCGQHSGRRARNIRRESHEGQAAGETGSRAAGVGGVEVRWYLEWRAARARRNRRAAPRISAVLAHAQGVSADRPRHRSLVAGGHRATAWLAWLACVAARVCSSLRESCASPAPSVPWSRTCVCLCDGASLPLFPFLFPSLSLPPPLRVSVSLFPRRAFPLLALRHTPRCSHDPPQTARCSADQASNTMYGTPDELPPPSSPCNTPAPAQTRSPICMSRSPYPCPGLCYCFP